MIGQTRRNQQMQLQQNTKCCRSPATKCPKVKRKITAQQTSSSTALPSCQSQPQLNSQPISQQALSRQQQQHPRRIAMAGPAGGACVELSSNVNNNRATIIIRSVKYENAHNRHTQQKRQFRHGIIAPTKSANSSAKSANLLGSKSANSDRKSAHFVSANFMLASLMVTLITLMPPFISNHKPVRSKPAPSSGHSNNFWLAEAQCQPNMMTTFERITGVTVKGSPMVTLYNAMSAIQSGTNQSLSGGGGPMLMPSQLMNQRQQNSAFSQVALAPITAECNNRCRKNTRCRAFLVDYEKHTCHGVEQMGSQNQQSATALARSPPPIVLVPTQDRTSYFEKVCVQPVTACERAWLFERVPSYHIINYDNKIIENVQNRLKCQELCLSEKDFRCRSGEYDYITEQCRLSIQDRHSRPDSFRPAPSNIDYFENQCASDGASCDTFDRFDEFDLGRPEIMRNAYTAEQCQNSCITTKAFLCRSFTFNTMTGKCYLNSDDSLTVGGFDRLIPAHGHIYAQRSDCLDLKLDCDTNVMTLHLRTQEPFKGRMYVKDEPAGCEMMGRSQTDTSLIIPFSGQSRCASRDDRGKYTSLVVVQHHPMIQRKTDRYVKVVCDFQTSNRTISNSYNVMGHVWASTALVNATSTAPQIKLRITDKFGGDITGAKLGDELYLRIEAETESIFDMVARSVLAKSGTTEESIMLIDKDGCPTDLRIFPSLKKLDKRTLIGKFDAFKFSSDVVVRFQVDVQFCLHQCPQVICEQPSSSSLFHTNTNVLLDQSTDLSSSTASLSGANNNNNLTSTTISGLSPLSQSSVANSLAGSTVADSLHDTTGLGSMSGPQPTTRPALNHMTGHNMTMSPQSLSDMVADHNGLINNHAHHSHMGLIPTPGALEQQQQQQDGGSLMDNFHHDMLPSGSLSTPMVTSNVNGFLSPHDSGSGIGHTADQQQQQQQQQQQAVSLMADSLMSNTRQMDSPANTNQQQFSGKQLRHLDNGLSRRKRQQDGGEYSATDETSWNPSHHQIEITSRPTSNNFASNGGAPRLKTDYALHREIIVESGPSPAKQPAAAAAATDSGASHQQSNQARSSRHHNQAKHHHTMQASASSDAVNVQSQQPTKHARHPHGLAEGDYSRLSSFYKGGDPTQMFCTTRYSLVLASAGFCLIQLLSVILCLGSWVWKRKRFQVKHHIDERLY